MLLLAFWSALDIGEFSCSCLLPKPDIPQAFDLFEAKSHFFSSIQVVKQQSNRRLSCWSLLCLTLTWKDVVREHWVWWNWTLDFQNFQTDGGRSFKFFKKNCAEHFRYFCQLGCTPCRSMEAQNTSDTLQKNKRVMTHEFFSTVSCSTRIKKSRWDPKCWSRQMCSSDDLGEQNQLFG